MKAKILLIAFAAIVGFCVKVKAQKPIFPKPNSSGQAILGSNPLSPAANEREKIIGKMYGKKRTDLPYTSFDTVLKKFVVTAPGSTNTAYLSAGAAGSNGNRQTASAAKPVPPGFHLTKDINTATAGSFPYNFPANSFNSYAVLNNVSYFTADDGTHGAELWRSDGSMAGTYLVKDIITGGDSASAAHGIIAANGLLFFSAYTSDAGEEPWVSDGTEAGTHVLLDINPGFYGSFPNQFVNVNGAVFFSTSLYGYNDQLWKTDGTAVGTVPVKNIVLSGIGYGNIFELTAVNDVAYFIAFTYSSGFQLCKSDGTDAGTSVVREIGFYNSDANAPTQLTSYNNKLYFSGNDGSGRKLWESDGTYDGTHYATGFNDVFLQPDYVSIYNNTPMLVLNNVLYLAGFTFADGSGLYKYNASNADGIVLVIDFTSTSDIDFAVPVDMRIVNDVLYFKVISNTGDWHDELWSTQGETANTLPVKVFVPGEYTYYFKNGGGTLFFVKYDNVNGNELWKSNGTDAGTVLVKDIFPGQGGSFPEDLTFCNSKLLFRAADVDHSNELWASDGTDLGTVLVKDINSLYTEGSNAGFWYKGVGTTPNGVLFNAFTPALGGELYKSDGTAAGTVLLNDIAPGPDWSFPNAFLYKNKVNYFINDNAIGTALLKSDGTAAGLKRITAYINRDDYYVVNFNITDNGQAFYILGNKHTFAYELWHSDGTAASGAMLSPNINFLNYNDYIVTIGNTAFFAAGDFTNGYELWKSDGTVAGTKLVKDINAGFGWSSPYSLFAYKNNVYFGAYDGFGFNYSLWKSDGTESGTVKLVNLTPAYFNENGVDPTSPIFCISNGQLYFTATDFNTYGAELWKTNGTVAGTKLVKDINPYYSSFPSNLTDVNGKVYFTADDGVHGTELWFTDGTTQGTKLVKDISPDFGSSYLSNLCNANGRLYFLNNSTYPNTLWSSDGTADNTNQVTGLSNISHLTPSGKQLFFGASAKKYGTELWVGDAGATTFTVARVSIPDMVTAKPDKVFEAVLYPNPVKGSASLQIKGNAADISVTVTDMGGKLIWQGSYTNRTQISLPTEKLTAGMYMVTVRSSTGSKNIKLVKE